MTSQLQIFATGISCSHCLQDPGRSARNGNLWDGFFDLDLKQHVCRDCKQLHYNLKSKTEKRNLYSEFPVMAESFKKIPG